MLWNGKTAIDGAGALLFRLTPHPASRAANASAAPAAHRNHRRGWGWSGTGIGSGGGAIQSSGGWTAVTGAVNRYPRFGTVSMNWAALSPSASALRSAEI